MLFGLFRWSWAVALSSYQRPPSAASRLRVMQQVSAAIQLRSRGQKSAANCARSSFSGWVTNWSRQRGGFDDLFISSWHHHRAIYRLKSQQTKHPPFPNPLQSHAYSPKAQPGEEGAARKGRLPLLGLFSFAEWRYYAAQRSSDRDDWWPELLEPPACTYGKVCGAF